MKRFARIVLYPLFLIPLALVRGQDGIGIPSLKIVPGARHAGMAGTAAGIGDDLYTVFTNPGGIGHLRRWQWALGYNRWFSDVYQADACFVKQASVLGSAKTAAGTFISMVGMPVWDATEGQQSPVIAESWIAGFSLGQRLDWLHRSLSIGLNLKAVYNRLNAYTTTVPAGDAGLLFKPGRFYLGGLGFGAFDYGLFAAGLSVVHVGPKVVFISEGTSLPMTWRGGCSFLVGRNNGWSWLLAADWNKIIGRDGFISAGTEIWWKGLVGCRAGYRADGLDLGGFTFGFGLRWENAMTSVLGLPSRFGDAFQVDFAEASYGEVLNETYRGALIHYPISPEPFHLSDPREQRAWIQGEPHSVFLDWEKASDPDPFDEVKYFLMVDPSKPKIETAVRELEENSGSLREWTSAIGQELMFTTVVAEPEYTLSVEEGGFYYWAVAAFDLAGHVRIARKGDGKVGRFIVAVPDLMARNLEFLPLQAILPAPDQGELTFNIVNQGTAASGGFVVWVQTRLLPGRHAGTAFQTIRSMAVSDLAFGADTTVTIPWQAVRPGWYEIRVVVDPDSAVVEYREDNNSLSVFVATLPKGRVTVPDSVEVMVTGYDSQEVPIVPEVFFEAHSNNVDSAYFVPKGNLPALLTALAERLLEHPDIQVKLYGSIDLLSGENDPALADTRAQAVQSALVNLGILPDRLEVVQEHPQRILGRRTMPANPQDAEWIMQQDRLVSFSVPQKDEEILFQPFRFAVDTTMRDSVQFHVQFVSPAGVRRWDLESGSSILDIHKDGAAFSDSVSGLYSWRGTDQGKVVVARNRWVPYRLVLTDTLGRTFSTAVDSIFIQEKRTVRRQELFGAAKFAQVEPVYAFYWDRVMSVAEEMIKDRSLRLRFEGHACAIGPDYVNNKLSLERAQSFTKAFLDRVKSTYPLDYQDIANRTAQPIGFGEKEPLIVKIKGLGDVLLGDNRSPIGRYLNRRIAVLLYREY